MISIGDRVAVYDDAKRYVGKIGKIVGPIAYVDIPRPEISTNAIGCMKVALKQCRKLVSNTRREWWIGKDRESIHRMKAFVIDHVLVKRDAPPKFLKSDLGADVDARDWQWILVREVKKP